MVLQYFYQMQQILAVKFSQKGILHCTRITYINGIRSDQTVTYLLGVTVSAFANKRKISPFTLLKKELWYQEAFQMLGRSRDVPEGMKIVVEEFTCHLHGMKVTSVSEPRYLLCPRQHILRANHPAYI